MHSAGLRDAVYIAVIGDIVDSRSLADRADVQLELEKTLAGLNEAYEDVIASRFLVTLGDEFQGLLEVEARISDVWWWIQDRLRERIEVRFGFGLGPLATALKPEALGMDGPCFHAARQALDASRDSGVQIAFGVTGDAKLTQSLNSLAGLLDSTTRGWTSTQWETIAKYRDLRSQTAVAKEREVSKSTVYRALVASSGLECLQAWAGFELLLERLARAWSTRFEEETAETDRQ
ncbi:MAG: SatD family protein [Acidobacteriota bacterium]